VDDFGGFVWLVMKASKGIRSRAELDSPPVSPPSTQEFEVRYVFSGRCLCVGSFR
jgi:hypothetical protein